MAPTWVEALLTVSGKFRTLAQALIHQKHLGRNCRWPFHFHAKSEPAVNHAYSDGGGSATSASITGGAGFLAGGVLYPILSRQHLTAPEVHTIEVVAGGTGLNMVGLVNAILQEMQVRLGKATPYYFDSSSTVFVANNEKAIKRSVWLIRRVKVLLEAVEYGDIIVIHIGDAYMVADVFTKYLKYERWHRHVVYLNNAPIKGPAAKL